MKKFIAYAIALALLASAVWAAIYYSGHTPKLKRNHAIGDVVDSLHGVYVYFNGPISNVSGRNLAKDGYNLGLKYQCVEFVKRYYYQHLNHKMPDSYGHAKDFFDKNTGDGKRNRKRNLLQYTNRSSAKPKLSDLIIFDGNRFNPYGHVAIISSVGLASIEIIQQNPGSTAHSRDKIALYHENGKWRVGRSDCLGWLRKGQ